MYRLLRKWRLMSLCLAMSLAASGCASTSATNPCSWVKPITVSKDDKLTDRTVEEILSHNEKYEAICK